MPEVSLPFSTASQGGRVGVSQWTFYLSAGGGRLRIGCLILDCRRQKRLISNQSRPRMQLRKDRRTC